MGHPPRARDISTGATRSNSEINLLERKECKKKTAAEAAVECAKVLLEAEVRSESYPQVIPGAIQEVDFVPHFSAQTECSPEAFHADAGVHREPGVPLIYVTEGLAHTLRAVGEVQLGDRPR